jgi:hypothetical protein
MNIEVHVNRKLRRYLSLNVQRENKADLLFHRQEGWAQASKQGHGPLLYTTRHKKANDEYKVKVNVSYRRLTLMLMVHL